jgi:hypothetical protein
MAQIDVAPYEAVVLTDGARWLSLWLDWGIALDQVHALSHPRKSITEWFHRYAR